MDQIERHDLLNAVLLAVVLLILGWGIVTFAGRLFDTLDEGLVISSKDPAATADGGTGSGGAAGSDPEAAAGDEDTTTSTTIGEARPAEQVRLVVVNGGGAEVQGDDAVAALGDAGYQAFSPQSVDEVSKSTIYYTEGYAADGFAVGAAVGIAPVEPAPQEPPVPLSDTDVLVVLGPDYTPPEP